MVNFKAYLTPMQYYRMGTNVSLEELIRRASAKTQPCANCDEDSWKLLRTGLCFYCTTGESDASQDYELCMPPLPHALENV